MRTWRIASAPHAACDGEGTRLFGSRWTPKGLAAVFTSATLSLACLERFVHTDPDLEPPDLVAMAVDIGDAVEIDELSLAALPASWRHYPAPAALAAIGERWLRDARTAVLGVPSVVIPTERNFILNPAHPGFRTLRIHAPEPFSFDARMWDKKR